MKITMVKKIFADGRPCAKCADVLARLESSGHIDRIDVIVDAREDDPDSPGMQLAKQYEVDRAPFFVVETDNNAEVQIYTVYLKLVMEVLEA